MLRTLACLLVISTCLTGCGTKDVAPIKAPSQSSTFNIKTNTSENTAHSRPINLAANAQLASINSNTNKLHYALYSNQGQNNAVHIIPDFSYAGFKQGGVALPVVPTIETLKPNHSGDDFARIQAAIDRIAQRTPDANGFRGALKLLAGQYTIDQPLKLMAGGIVLRGEGRGGEGQGEDGTRLRSINKANRASIVQIGHPYPEREAKKATNAHTVSITTPTVAVGSTALEVESTQGYTVGDRIVIVKTPNKKWVGPEGVNNAKHGWRAADYIIAHERTLSAVKGKQLHFFPPMVDTIEAYYGGGHVYRADVSDRIQHVGIEDIRLEGNPNTPVTGGSMDGPFVGISIHQTENSWVKNTTFRYVSHAIETQNGAHFNTFQDLNYIDPRFTVTGRMRYAYALTGNSTNNLFQRCHADKARHSFVTQSRVPGPNVFLDCTATNALNDSGPHHRWATGILYDNTAGAMLRVHNRATSGGGHGWAGAQHMFWNTQHKQYVIQAPKGAMNYAVGITGTLIPGAWSPNEPNGIIESQGKPVKPRSLYLQQLKDRLGEQAVINVTTFEQRDK